MEHQLRQERLEQIRNEMEELSGPGHALCNFPDFSQNI